MDAARLLRLIEMARQALDANPPEHGSAWEGVASTYEMVRGQAAGMVEPDDRDEFEVLFPPSIDVSSARRSDPMALFAQQEVNSNARTRLASLMGWLNGCLLAADRAERLALEAEKYAEARLRAERA